MTRRPTRASFTVTFDQVQLSDEELRSLYNWAAIFGANISRQSVPDSTGQAMRQLEVSIAEPTDDSHVADVVATAFEDAAAMLRGADWRSTSTRGTF